MSQEHIKSKLVIQPDGTSHWEDGNGEIIDPTSTLEGEHLEIIIDEDSNLETVLDFVEAIEPGEIKTFTLPEKIEFDSFLFSLGSVKRSYEYGGDYNPISREVRVTRSETRHSVYGSIGEALPSVGYHNRRDDSERIIGNLWHIHPVESQERVYQDRYRDKYRLEMNCLPSTEDNAVIFKTSLAEQVDGKGRTFLSLISASGFISETIAQGIHLDLDELRKLRCDDDAIQNLLRYLTYEPHTSARHFAKKGKEEELLSRLSDFYKKKLKFDGSFYRQIDDFLKEIKDLLIEGREFRRMTTTAFDVLREDMYRELAEYPDRKKLYRLGFKAKEQQDSVLLMLGMKTNVYKVDDEGNKVYVLEDVFSCDAFEEGSRIKDTKEVREGIAPPIPERWTYMVHGSNLKREQWQDGETSQLDSDRLTVKGMGFSVISREEVARQSKISRSTTRTYSNSPGGEEGLALEIKVVVPSFHSRNRNVREAERYIKEKYGDEVYNKLLEFSDKTYWKNHQSGRHPLIAKNTVLIKLSESTSTDKRVIWYIPEELKGIYNTEVSSVST